MAKSQRLRLSELREVFLLVGECCELGPDPLAWRRHMAERLPAVVGAQTTSYGEVVPVAPPGQEGWLRWRLSVSSGWASEADRRVHDEDIRRNTCLYHCPWFRPPHYRRFFHPRGGFATIGRVGLLSDEEWEREPHKHLVRMAHLDEWLVATHVGDDGVVRGLCLYRPRGDRPFEPRQTGTLALFCREHTQHLGRRLARCDAPSVLELPDRLREVLRGLLEGEGEKELAGRLGISRHTVHYHVKQLHQRFGVTSRGELLARCRDYWPALRSADNGWK
jgi:DNA-binding CsgD family transcriptional regulator